MIRRNGTPRLTLTRRWSLPARSMPFVSFDDLSVRDTDFPPRRLAPIDVPRPLIHPAAPGFVSEESFHGSLLNTRYACLL